MHVGAPPLPGLSFCTRFMAGLALLTALAALAGHPIAGSAARAAEPLVGAETGLPLPRFVSLKAGKVNVRVGPSRSHPVLWVYQRKGLPIEIVAEFEHWRRIRDADGDIGWVHQSLLDGARTALVTGESPADTQTVSLYALPDSASTVVAAAEPGVVAELAACRVRWCQVSAGGYTGWTQKSHLWGSYADETFE